MAYVFAFLTTWAGQEAGEGHFGNQRVERDPQIAQQPVRRVRGRVRGRVRVRVGGWEGSLWHCHSESTYFENRARYFFGVPAPPAHRVGHLCFKKGAGGPWEATQAERRPTSPALAPGNGGFLLGAGEGHFGNQRGERDPQNQVVAVAAGSFPICPWTKSPGS